MFCYNVSGYVSFYLIWHIFEHFILVIEGQLNMFSSHFTTQYYQFLCNILFNRVKYTKNRMPIFFFFV